MNQPVERFFTWLNKIITLQYPHEVTLDDFGFRIGGRLAAWQAIFLCYFLLLLNTKGEYPQLWSSINKTCWDHLSFKKNKPHGQRRGPERNYKEKAVSGLSKIDKRSENTLFFLHINHPLNIKKMIFIWKNCFFLPINNFAWSWLKHG